MCDRFRTSSGWVGNGRRRASGGSGTTSKVFWQPPIDAVGSFSIEVAYANPMDVIYYYKLTVNIAAPSSSDPPTATPSLFPECSASDCCTVLLQGAPGTHCSPVPVWNFNNWVHPGPSSVTKDRVCNSVSTPHARARAHAHIHTHEPDSSAPMRARRRFVTIGFRSPGRTRFSRIPRM